MSGTGATSTHPPVVFRIVAVLGMALLALAGLVVLAPAAGADQPAGFDYDNAPHDLEPVVGLAAPQTCGQDGGLARPGLRYDYAAQLARTSASSPAGFLAPQTTGDCEMVPVWFGQARISPSFRSGRSIQDPPIGRIEVFTDARARGVYIAESNRTLASYSLAGAPTAPACMMSSVPANVRNRLNDPPLPPQTSLPSPVVPVTKSISDPTPVAPYVVTSTVSVPRSLPPC